MPFSADWTRTVPRFTNKNNDSFYHEFENRVYALRAEIKGEIWCGNGGLSLKILDPALFPPKISTKISCRRQFQ